MGADSKAVAANLDFRIKSADEIFHIFKVHGFMEFIVKKRRIVTEEEASGQRVRGWTAAGLGFSQNPESTGRMVPGELGLEPGDTASV